MKRFKINPDSFIAKNREMTPHKAARIVETEGGAVAFSINTFHYYQLNEMALYIWQLLVQEKKPGKAYNKLKDEFDDVPEKDILNDFVRVCSFFLNNKLWRIKRF